MKKIRGIEKFIENGSAIGVDYTNRTCRTSPAPATESPAEPTPNNPAAVTLRRTSPHLAEIHAARCGTLRRRGGEKYIYTSPPRRGVRQVLGELSAAPHFASRPRRGAMGQDGRTEDGGRTAADQGKRRTADGQTDRPIKEKTGVVYIIRSLHNPTRVACLIGRA